MHIANEYELGEEVYLKTDVDQNPRIIVGVMACVDGGILYELSAGTLTTKNYEAEMSGEKRVF